jgi:hypothetical protein
MSEFESRLREALREAVPPDLESHGLAQGAQQYAVHARRMRVATAAVVAAVAVAIAGSVGAGLFRERAVPPANPRPLLGNVAPYECKERVPVSDPPATAQSSHGEFGSAWHGDVLARLCATSAEGAGMGWVLPTTR